MGNLSSLMDNGPVTRSCQGSLQEREDTCTVSDRAENFGHILFNRVRGCAALQMCRNLGRLFIGIKRFQFYSENCPQNWEIGMSLRLMSNLVRVHGHSIPVLVNDLAHSGFHV